MQRYFHCSKTFYHTLQDQHVPVVMNVPFMKMHEQYTVSFQEKAESDSEAEHRNHFSKSDKCCFSK